MLFDLPIRKRPSCSNICPYTPARKRSDNVVSASAVDIPDGARVRNLASWVAYNSVAYEAYTVRVYNLAVCVAFDIQNVRDHDWS